MLVILELRHTTYLPGRTFAKNPGPFTSYESFCKQSTKGTKGWRGILGAHGQLLDSEISFVNTNLMFQ